MIRNQVFRCSNLLTSPGLRAVTFGTQLNSFSALARSVERRRLSASDGKQMVSAFRKLSISTTKKQSILDSANQTNKNYYYPGTQSLHPIMADPITAVDRVREDIQRKEDQIKQIKAEIKENQNLFLSNAPQAQRDYAHSRIVDLSAQIKDLNFQINSLSSELVELRTQQTKRMAVAAADAGPRVVHSPSKTLAAIISAYVDKHQGQPCAQMRDLERNKQFDRFIARDESFDEMFEGFESQLGRLASRAPLHAVAGAPGAGKTRYLTQLQKKDELYARALRCKSMTKEHAALFEPDNVLVINITFNSFMPLQSGIESDTAIDGLVATRVLFQYFGPQLLGLPSNADYQDFCKAVRMCGEFSDVSARSCFKEILRHFESTFSGASRAMRGIFILGVDEIIKCRPADFDFVVNSISDIGKWTDQPIDVGQRQFVLMPVITSLSPLVLGKSTTSSGRIVQWIPLPPLHDIADQVCEVLSVTSDSAKQAMSILCHYLGEHGRLVEILVAKISAHPHLLVGGVQTIVEAYINLLICDNGTKDYLCPVGDDSPGIIAAAIRGEIFNIFDKPFGCGSTIDQLLVGGLYIDLQYVQRSKNEIRAIPRMSLFQMYAWAVFRTKRGDATTFARPLLALLKPPGKFNFDSFEHFHSCVEYIFRATEAYSVNPQQLHERLQRDSFYRSGILKKLAPGQVEMQELASVVDLRTLSNYQPGAESPQHRQTTHQEFVFDAFARVPNKVSPPAQEIEASFHDNDNLAAIVSLSAPTQPIFDLMSDSRYIDVRGNVKFVRDFWELKLKTDKEKQLKSWFVTRVLPFVEGLPMNVRSQCRFWFISTGDISETMRSECRTLCRTKNIQLTVFDESQLLDLYGPSLIFHPGLDHLKYLKNSLQQIKGQRKQLESAVTHVKVRSTTSARAPAIVPSSIAPDLGAESRSMIRSARLRAAEADVVDIEQGNVPAGSKTTK